MMGYGYMGGGGMLWMLILVALVIIPFWRLLPQFGIPSWVALLAIFPPAGLILLWVIAFRDKLEQGS